MAGAARGLFQQAHPYPAQIHLRAGVRAGAQFIQAGRGGDSRIDLLPGCPVGASAAGQGVARWVGSSQKLARWACSFVIETDSLVL